MYRGQYVPLCLRLQDLILYIYIHVSLPISHQICGRVDHFELGLVGLGLVLGLVLGLGEIPLSTARRRRPRNPCW